MTYIAAFLGLWLLLGAAFVAFVWHALRFVRWVLREGERIHETIEETTTPFRLGDLDDAPLRVNVTKWREQYERAGRDQ